MCATPWPAPRCVPHSERRACDTGRGCPAGDPRRTTRRHSRRVADRRRSRPRRTAGLGARGAGTARRARDGQRPLAPDRTTMRTRRSTTTHPGRRVEAISSPPRCRLRGAAEPHSRSAAPQPPPCGRVSLPTKRARRPERRSRADARQRQFDNIRTISQRRHGRRPSGSAFRRSPRNSGPPARHWSRCSPTSARAQDRVVDPRRRPGRASRAAHAAAETAHDPPADAVAAGVLEPCRRLPTPPRRGAPAVPVPGRPPPSRRTGRRRPGHHRRRGRRRPDRRARGRPRGRRGRGARRRAASGAAAAWRRRREAAVETRRGRRGCRSR